MKINDTITLIVIELTLASELMSETNLKIKHVKADDIYLLDVKAKNIFKFELGCATTSLKYPITSLILLHQL